MAKDGSQTSISISKIPLINSNNEIEGIIGMSLDITETRKAQKKLEEKERHFRSIFNSSYQFAGILDVDGTFIEINDTTLNFANLKTADIVGKKILGCLLVAYTRFHKESSKTNCQKAAVRGEFMRSEIVVFDQNKKPVPVDFTLKPIYDKNNEVVSLLAEGRMIAEMVAAREKLKESELKFRTLYEMAPVGFILYDFESGRILDSNPSFKNTFGYNKKNTEKITFWKLLDDGNKGFREQVDKELETKGTFGPFGEKLIDKNGSKYSVIIHKSLIVNKKGQKLVWTIIQDISESEKKEKQIREETQIAENGNRQFTLERLYKGQAIQKNPGQQGRMRLFRR